MPTRGLALGVMLVVGALALPSTSSGLVGAPGTSRRLVGNRAHLIDGYRLPANTRLIGAVFDDPMQGPSPTVRVLLDIERDPVGVYDALAAQGRGLGTPLRASGAADPNAATCRFFPDGSPVVQVAPTTVGARMLVCTDSVTLDDARGSTTTVLYVGWGETNHHAYLEVSRGSSTGFPAPVLSPSDTRRLEARVSLPPITPPPVSVGPGGTFGAPNGGFDPVDRQPRVEPGSRAIRGNARYVRNYDFIAVLRVDDDVDRVLTKYVKQLGTPGTHLSHGADLQGRRISYFFSSREGGGTAEMIASPHGHWILAYGIND